ncbi:MAG TPA: DoxX family protein [Candidatus Udaeobacter sp.]|nr:DoxX family protein [Candidatus Udaeobacter sp.]
MRELFITDAPAATVLVRIMAGSVFLSEGIQKFLYPEDLAAGRFAKIGIPAPETMGPFVGGCEVVCGALLIVGFLTRMMHEARTDFSMWLGLLFLLIVGAGRWSFDAVLMRRRTKSQWPTAAR